LGNKFLYACVKEVCCMWAQSRFDAFQHLEALWSQPVLQVGKGVVVTWSEIRAERRVVNNSQLKCSSSAWVQAAVCRHALLRRSTTPYVNILWLLFWMALHSFVSILQYTSDVTVVPCCTNSTINTPFLYQKTDAISFLADICLNVYGLSDECVYILCFDCSLVSTFTNEAQFSSPVTHTVWLRDSSPSLWYHSKKVKA
jgi:hypothetical protein